MKGDPGFGAGHQIHPGWRSVSGRDTGGFLESYRQLAGCSFPRCALDFPKNPVASHHVVVTHGTYELGGSIPDTRGPRARAAQLEGKTTVPGADSSKSRGCLEENGFHGKAAEIQNLLTHGRVDDCP